MPYRRLPKTDKTRLLALQRAVIRAGEAEYTDQAIHYKTLTEAQRFLMLFENQMAQYYTNIDTKVSANKQYRHKVRNARMYISHFIQVLNMAVVRGEIKKEHKALYHLSTDNTALPDLTSEQGILEWGEYIIEGEKKRIAQGGFPIYNPAINKVQVHYDIFKEQYTAHLTYMKNHSRIYGDMESMRAEADRIIFDIWNQVEEFYKDELPYAKMTKCKEYGVIFYYRAHEPHLSEETDKKIARDNARQTTLEWNETE